MPTRPQPVEIQQRSFSPVNSALLHQQVVQVAMPLTSQMHLFIDYFFLPQTILALGFLCSPGLFPPRRHLIFKTPHELLDDYEIIPSAKFIFFLSILKVFLSNIPLLSQIQHVPVSPFLLPISDNSTMRVSNLKSF